ncbi:PREDICTED: nuclear receptor 2C2-associated protein isoform X2 [Trachymyrmex septentrionalis]|uniref:nuclear receptor 2C2-associated protein isoform X2 n=1 Tax=Trachymyrmex septentrionalis TaxID=34720 RepID=UPI00084F1762|nr:PREDICTED: nuclear receptor 2C2-associated protein isoform X2 [Trachymyrmex septentrionalis]
MTTLLTENKFECRVSSVLNKNVQSYGKMCMFDNCSETCWNSDAGSPQWVLINFEEECSLSSFEVEFQGGFAGKNCHIEAGNDKKELIVVESFSPEDKNKLQRFNLKNQRSLRYWRFPQE